MLANFYIITIPNFPGNRYIQTLQTRKKNKNMLEILQLLHVLLITDSTKNI